MPICVECLILLGFSRVRGKWKVRFRPSLDHLKCVRNKTKNNQMGALQILFNVENYTLEIVHEENNRPVMCGNVSIRHRIFFAFLRAVFRQDGSQTM